MEATGDDVKPVMDDIIHKTNELADDWQRASIEQNLEE